MKVYSVADTGRPQLVPAAGFFSYDRILAQAIYFLISVSQ